MRRVIVAIGLLACCTLSPAWGRYARPQLEEVPVDRLVENLTKQIGDKPKDAELRLNLARVHGMAFAIKAETLQARKGAKEPLLWLGFEPRHVPFVVQPTSDEAKLKAAKAHLDMAIASFEEAIKLDPKNLTARLGHAWTLEQGGHKADAIKGYRDVVEAGWAAEKEMQTAGLGWHSVTAEAAGYLKPLLDPKNDANELAELEKRITKMSEVRRPITPLAIPLTASAGVEDLLAPEARVRFDVDGQRRGKHWNWITPQAGWLVHDRTGRGEITSGLQLFGNVTFWLFWENAYAPLAALDNDRDGRLTGAELSGLAIWHDRNSNGISEPGEVRPLAAHGIVALSCRGEACREHSSDVAAYSPAGVEFQDGSVRPTFDLILRSQK